ncbi:lecithin retinol acyltransferase family protein [Aeromonas veronii]
MRITVGDHVVTQRFGYTHHGLCVGDDQIIHYSGLGDSMSKGDICLSSLNEFTRGHDFWIKEHAFPRYSREESAMRAFKRLGEDWYNPVLNNCEHFVTWCITGFHSSEQVNNVIHSIAEAKTSELPKMNQNSDVKYINPTKPFTPTTVKNTLELDQIIKNVLNPSPLYQAEKAFDGIKKIWRFFRD